MKNEEKKKMRKEKKEKVKKHLEIIRKIGLKPNFSELSRIYGFDRRTIKKYWDEYEEGTKNQKQNTK